MVRTPPLSQHLNSLTHLRTAEDLPLNVSRETLQSNKFLKQLRNIIVRRLLQTLTRIQEEDKEKFDQLHKVYGNVIRLGAVEDTKSREKLATLLRFPTTQRNNTSLDDVSEISISVLLCFTID